MSLHAELQTAKSEEDVKAAYIKALKLEGASLGLIDIRTKDCWFEVKKDRVSSYEMFAQLLCYVKDANKKGEPLPPLLAVLDSKHAALMHTKDAQSIFKDKAIQWPTASASKVKSDQNFIAQVYPYITTHFVEFEIETFEKEFLATYAKAVKDGEIIRGLIQPDNLRIAFDKWVERVGVELEDLKKEDFALLFYADLMFDDKMRKTVVEDLPARLLFDGDQPCFLLRGKTYNLKSRRGYSEFWNIYHRPPEKDDRAYLLARRDSLLPLDARNFKGAFYTPLELVELAYRQLYNVLGQNWQGRYVVWDPCCGVGNLEVKHSNYRNIYMSTLDQEDVDIMKSNRTCLGATIFQYDYLNDDISDTGEIDYSLTNKMPKELKALLQSAKGGEKPEKKLLILMNPPYAEATSANTPAGTGENKSGVAITKMGQKGMEAYGKAGNELFTQFLARILKEVPNCAIATFSTLKYINAPNFELFRQKFQAEYKGGFIVKSTAFEGVNGAFPIGFLVWDRAKKAPITTVETKVYNVALRSKELILVEEGVKSFYNLPPSAYLNKWISRPRTNQENCVPLSSAINVFRGKVRLHTWSDKAIGYLRSGGNDFQNTQFVYLLSSAYGTGSGIYVTEENLWQIACYFTARKVFPPTWLNDRDQFYQPTAELSEEFKNDCLIWMLFHSSNLSAGVDGLEWNEKTWSLTNHFVPFTEKEAGGDRLESYFMIEYLQGKAFSAQALAVRAVGLTIWQKYFRLWRQGEFDKKLRDQFRLGRSDVGWYQIRMALQQYAKDTGGEDVKALFEPFKGAYGALTEKLRPLIYEYGFLKR